MTITPKTDSNTLMGPSQFRPPQNKVKKPLLPLHEAVEGFLLTKRVADDAALLVPRDIRYCNSEHLWRHRVELDGSRAPRGEAVA